MQVHLTDKQRAAVVKALTPGVGACTLETQGSDVVVNVDYVTPLGAMDPQTIVIDENGKVVG